MGIAVLGPLQVDGQVNGLSPRDRVVLSAMVVRAGDPISTEALADALWGEKLPTSWPKIIQGCVVRLRKRLGVAAIESGSSGYRLTLTEDELDHRQFQRLLERAREAMAGDDPARAAYLVQDALDLWRGRALTDVGEWAPGRVEAERLEGLQMDAEELRVEAEIGAGHAQAVLEQARSLVAHAPFRERRWVLLATALHQVGRQAEALGAVKRAKAMLVGELGLDPSRELGELEELLLRQDPSLAPPVEREVSAVCPYRGLLPYDAADAVFYFGRENDVAACLRRLRDTRVLAVVGPSGIGKSSLVRAGVVASLVRGGTPVLLTTPGPHPMDSLSVLKARGRQTLVVDQAEEAVTVCADRAERERYFTALAAHVGAGGALVLSLRADHLGDLAPYADIARVVEDGLYLLGPMSESDLRSAIEGPARRAGLRLEPGLVDLLVREVEGEPAALPMLSHVLRETWERREGPTLTVAGYRATGGIRYAVSQSAETLYEAMDEAQRSRLRTLLMRLVMPTEDGDAVRARVPRAKVTVDDQHRRLVEELVDARLVSIDGDSVQIAHESLVRVWPRLRDWLDDDVAGQRLFRHLAGAADAWDGMGRPDSELYRGARLSRTVEWLDRAGPDLNDTEAAFVRASVALSETELLAAEARIRRERKVNRRLRGALGGVAVLLVLTLVAGLVAVRTADQARTERDRAERAAIVAEARRVSGEGLTVGSIPVSLLLGVAALKLDPSPQSRENLATTLTKVGSLRGVHSSDGAVVSVAASGDGTLVAASDAIEGVSLFDASSLQPVEFEDRTPMSVVTFSPNGKLLISAVNQWTGGAPRIDPQPVRFYEMPGGQLSAHQPGGWPSGANVEYSLDLSADGSRLAAGVNRWVGGTWAKTGAVMVWDVASPAKPVFDVALPELTEAALSPDGSRVYTASNGERPLRVYDVDSGRLLQWGDIDYGIPEGADWGLRSDMSPDGSTLALGNGAGTRVLQIDTSTLKVRGAALTGHTGEVMDVEYTHDGSKLLSASTDGSVVVWDAKTGIQLNRFAARDASIWGAAFGADDGSLYAVVDEGLAAWDLTGRQNMLSVGAAATTGQRYRVSVPAPDGHTIARVGTGVLWFVDNRNGAEKSRHPVSDRFRHFVWSPDSRWLLGSSTDGDMRLWDASSGAVVANSITYVGDDPVAAFSTDGTKVYVAASGGAVLSTLDRATMQVQDDVYVGPGVTSILPDPKGDTVTAVRGDGSVYRVDLKTNQRIAVTGSVLGEDPVGALSPDGRLVATSDRNGNLRLLDVDTLKWTGANSQVLAGSDVTFSPDGRQIAAVQADRVWLWDGRAGDYQASVSLPTGLVGDVSIVYLPDSSGLLLSATDGRTWTVKTRVGTWVQRACRIAGRNLTRAEWRRFFPDRPYELTCPQWPAGR